MNSLPTLSPTFVAEVIKEVRRVFGQDSHVKDAILTFGVGSSWSESERNVLAEIVSMEVSVYEYPRQVKVFVPFPDPTGQHRVFVHIFNDDNASGQELAPK